MFLEWLFRKSPPLINCNASRLYLGSYVVGTNQDAFSVDCRYEVIKGTITLKRLNPVHVSDETGGSKLDCVVVYPSSDVAELLVYGRKNFRIKLFKVEKGKVSRMFKQRL